MRITALSAGLLLCVPILALQNSANAQASTADALQTSASLLAAVTEEVKEPTEENVPTEEAATEEPQEQKYTVAKGDNLSKIAKKYDTTWVRLFNKNDKIVDPDIINAGDKIIIPRADEVLDAREIPSDEPAPAARPVAQEAPARTTQVVESSEPAANCDEETQWVRADNGQCIDKPTARRTQSARQATSTTTRTSTAQPAARTTVPRGSSAGNTYTYGYCTWYVKNRRPDLPNNLGDADTWLARARAQGFATGSKPRVGAVAYALTGRMHVAYVERVNANGTVTVSEMNVRGWNVRSTRTLPASSFSYIYWR